MFSKTSFTIVILPIFIVMLSDVSDSFRILAFAPLPLRSHYAVAEPILKALAERGDIVDVVTFYPQEKPIPRYNDISLKGVYPDLTNGFTPDLIARVFPKNKFIYFYNFFKYLATDMCDHLLKSKVIRDLYKNGNQTKYDVIIMELFSIDCMLVFGHRFKNVPMIGFSTTVPNAWHNDRFGLPDNPAFLPNWGFNFTAPMPLEERLLNTVANLLTKWSYYYFQPSKEQLRRIFEDDEIPSLQELEKKVNLFLINTHYSFTGSRPLPANVKEIAGVHIKPMKPLPKYMETLLNNSKNGVILLSLGSLTKPEDFPLEKQRAIIEAFKELPYTVIWKINKNKLPESLPENIHCETWVPQREILCHPNTKLFISHGGAMGSLEAIQCGVPIVGMPFFSDQPINVQYLVKMGVAVELLYEDLTKVNLLNAVRTVLGNSSYTETAKYRAIIYQDRPMSPIDTALYWIDYVIRHKGAHHLRPLSSDLAWYQLYLLDVFAIIFVSIIITIVVLYLIVYKIYQILKKIIIKKIKTKLD